MINARNDTLGQVALHSAGGCCPPAAAAAAAAGLAPAVGAGRQQWPTMAAGGTVALQMPAAPRRHRQDSQDGKLPALDSLGASAAAALALGTAGARLFQDISTPGLLAALISTY